MAEQTVMASKDIGTLRKYDVKSITEEMIEIIERSSSAKLTHAYQVYQLTGYDRGFLVLPHLLFKASIFGLDPLEAHSPFQ